MTDILFKTDDYIFSYRVAGICIINEKILLQKPSNDNGYALPGGHVSLGETNEETLIRECKEETGIDIDVNELKWVGEIFFDWGNKPCHQICLYYAVSPKNQKINTESKFSGCEQLEGRDFELEFYWIPIEDLKNIEVYPTNAVNLIENINKGVQHFIYREN